MNNRNVDDLKRIILRVLPLLALNLKESNLELTESHITEDEFKDIQSRHKAALDFLSDPDPNFESSLAEFVYLTIDLRAVVTAHDTANNRKALDDWLHFYESHGYTDTNITLNVPAKHKSDASKSPFRDWFVKQHGSRPSRKSLVTLQEELSNIRSVANEKEREYLQTLDWENRFQSALYAWQAREKI